MEGEAALLRQVEGVKRDVIATVMCLPLVATRGNLSGPMVSYLAGEASTLRALMAAAAGLEWQQDLRHTASASALDYFEGLAPAARRGAADLQAGLVYTPPNPPASTSQNE